VTVQPETLPRILTMIFKPFWSMTIGSSDIKMEHLINLAHGAIPALKQDATKAWRFLTLRWAVLFYAFTP
jgi:hypothetical protein